MSAMERQLQCVLPSAGSVSSVLRSSTMTSSSSMERGFPGLRSSYRPMRPWVRKRSRHLPTVWRLVPTSSATALLSNPSAHRSTILARLTSPAARLRERERDSSSSRVLPLTSSGFNGRPRSMASPSSEWMRGNILYSCHYVHVFTGHDTRSSFSPLLLLSFCGGVRGSAPQEASGASWRGRCACASGSCCRGC